MLDWSSLIPGMNRLQVNLSGCLANEPMCETVQGVKTLLEEEAAVCVGLQACSGIRRDKANTADQC